MKNQVLQILHEHFTNPLRESASTFSIRYRAMAEMCSRYNLTLKKVERPEPGMPLILWGHTKEWFDSAHTLYGKDCQLIMKGNPAAYAEYDISVVGNNTASEAKKVLEYLQAAGRTRIALLAPNRLQFESLCYVPSFLEKAAEMGIAMDDSCVFWDSGVKLDDLPYLLEECYGNFRKAAHKFDAVVCYNTQAAVYLCARAREDGIRIPEDLWVIGRGNLRTASFVSPTITTISVDEEEVGQQLVRLYRYLSSNPYVQSVTALLDSHLVPRESTACAPLPEKDTSARDYSVLDVKRISSNIYLSIGYIEQLLSGCTEMDFRILKGLRRGESREKIAEREFITVPTLRYRLKRMLKFAGVKNREELFALLDRYHINID